jgi:hypothetical protein
MTNNENTQNRGPECLKCKFLKITYIPATPYSCILMGFKSRWLPSLEVLRADGDFCKGFEPKKIKTARPRINIKA